MMKRPNVVLLAVLSSISSILSTSALAETSTVEVEGVAAVVKNDVATARDRAIDDARRKAVEQVVGSVVASETLSQNFQVVEDRILARASGFVRSYEILEEVKEEALYKVKLRAVVDGSAVAENLDQIFKVRPRVILMIAEQNVGAKDFSYWWGDAAFVSEMDILQTSLIDAWQPKGFKFIDPGLLKNQLRIDGPMKNPALSNEGAISIGRRADADVAIVGKVLITDAGPVMEGVKMHAFQAVGTLRALNVDTGEIIAVADETATAPHIDANVGGRAAVKALAEKLGDPLVGKILAKWTAEEASARELELVVGGKPSRAHLTAFEQAVRDEIRGVESIRLRRRAGGRVHYEVRVRARSADFGQDLEAKEYPAFRVELDRLTKSQVVVRLVGNRGS